MLIKFFRNVGPALLVVEVSLYRTRLWTIFLYVDHCRNFNFRHRLLQIFIWLDKFLRAYTYISDSIQHYWKIKHSSRPIIKKEDDFGIYDNTTRSWSSFRRKDPHIHLDTSHVLLVRSLTWFTFPGQFSEGIFVIICGDVSWVE